jgi:putative nucleotidyltransferase with HDIG domain
MMNDKGAGEENYYHSLNVAVLAMLLGKELALPQDDIKLLGVGCLFHDIGKVEIPDWLVQKPGHLTSAEKHLLQQHCHYGEAIAHKIGLPPRAIEIIMQHHECIDGSGYPKQLKGDQIAPLAGIVAIVNTYENHCNRPNPADSLSPYEALSTMFARQRSQFDPGPLSVFIRCMGVYPPGTIVRLSNDVLGMVVSVNSGKPLRPSVLIYDPSVPKEEALIVDLLDEPELSVAASLKPAQLPREVHDYLSPRKRMMYFFDTPKPEGRART